MIYNVLKVLSGETGSLSHRFGDVIVSRSTDLKGKSWFINCINRLNQRFIRDIFVHIGHVGCNTLQHVKCDTHVQNMFHEICKKSSESCKEFKSVERPNEEINVVNIHCLQ